MGPARSDETERSPADRPRDDRHRQAGSRRSVRIDADNVVAYGDGERIGRLPVQLDVVPGALLVHA